MRTVTYGDLLRGNPDADRILAVLGARRTQPVPPAPRKAYGLRKAEEPDPDVCAWMEGRRTMEEGET